jgi:hypothetical protein
MASSRKKKSGPAKKASTGPKGAHDAARHVDEELDACDLALDETEITPDEDLPVAEGGVA